MHDKLKKLKEDAHWFVEMAFIAINRKNEKRIGEFLEAASILDKDYSLIDVARASLHLHKMNFKEAKTLLENTLKKHPGHSLATVFLAMLHTIAGDPSKGKDLFNSLRDSSSKEVKKMVSSSDQFVKQRKKESNNMTDKLDPTKKIKKTIAPQQADTDDVANFAKEMKSGKNMQSKKAAKTPKADVATKTETPTAASLTRDKDVLHKKTEHLVSGLKRVDAKKVKKQHLDVILKHSYKYNDSIKDINKRLGIPQKDPKIKATDNPVLTSLKLLSNGEESIDSIAGKLTNKEMLTPANALLVQKQLNNATISIDYVTGILSQFLAGFKTLMSTQI